MVFARRRNWIAAAGLSIRMTFKAERNSPSAEGANRILTIVYLAEGLRLSP